MIHPELALGFVLPFAGAMCPGHVAASPGSRLGCSPLPIGPTRVDLGPSAPDLVTSLRAAFGRPPGVAVGNVVRSDVANVPPILAASAGIAPVSAAPAVFVRNGTALRVATLLCVGGVLHGAIGPSPPDLVTSVPAAPRHRSAIAFGNVVSSSICRSLCVAAPVGPVAVPPRIAAVVPRHRIGRARDPAFVTAHGGHIAGRAVGA